MVLPNPDQQDLGFPDSPTNPMATFRTLLAFRVKLFEDIRTRWATLLLTFLVTLVWTKAGENIQSVIPDGHHFFAKQKSYLIWNVCGHCNYPNIDWSVLIGLFLLAFVVFRERRNISKIVDLSARVHLHSITATVALLVILTYCLVELLFGPGEGYEWASDYVVAYAATWALRLLLSWREYGGKLSDEANLKAEEIKADEAAKSGSDMWFEN